MSKRSFTIWDIDWITVGLFFGLAFIGWLMIYAAGYNPSEPSSPFSIGTPAGRQFLFLIVAGFVSSAILLIDPQLFKTFSSVIYGIAVFLLLFVLVYGGMTNGATSWFVLPGGFKLQPSEIAKFATCLTLATFMSGLNISMLNLSSVLQALAIILVPTVLIVIQGDPGSALVFLSLFIVLFREGLHWIFYVLGFTFIVLFVSGLMLNPQDVILVILLIGALVGSYGLRPYRWWRVAYAILFLASIFLYRTYPYEYAFGFIIGFLIVSLGFGAYKQKRATISAMVALCLVVMSSFVFSINYVFNEVLKPHQQDRINVWLMPEKADPRGSYYNLRQSKLAIGSGSWLGKGPLNGEMTQGNFVPEQHTDFIFTVVGEENGFIGASALLLGYLFLLLRIVFLAERQRSKFTRLYAYGVASIISFHLLINVGMTMGLMPVIGIPLPLLSYGGSSLLTFTIMMAVLIRFDSQRLLVFR